MALTCDEIADQVGGPSKPPAPAPTHTHLVFQARMSAYYKTERARAEDCLGDIITILSDKQKQNSEQIDQILIRLIDHYERS